MQSSAKYNLRRSDRGTYGDNESSDSQARRFVGKDLKKIRKKYEISQRCFAEMLVISVKTLQNYEIDHRAMPILL
jgi:DNA-binding transcriptional regulator YiaG